MREISARKQAYRARLEQYLEEYDNILIVGVDNVGSKQIQDIRISLRGRAIVLMGKNTIMRKVIRDLIPTKPKLASLLPVIAGNMGFVFTNESLVEIRKEILENKKPAAARVGVFAPNDVVVPAGPTGLDPGQTSFFQVLQIATKIVRGAIEIINPVNLIKKGDKVNPSQVSLLGKLNIRPFFFGMAVLHIYESGSVYNADILDITEDDLLAKFFNGVRYLACLSLQIGLPNLATIPHSFARAYQNLLALAVTTDITFEQAERYKLFLSDPAAYAEKYGGSAAPAAGGDAPAEEAKKEEPEEEESSDDMGGGGLFGDDSDSSD